MSSTTWIIIGLIAFYTPFVVYCIAWRNAARKMAIALEKVEKFHAAVCEKLREAKELLTEDAALIARLYSNKERLNETIIEKSREIDEYNRLTAMAYKEFSKLQQWYDEGGNDYCRTPREMQMLNDIFEQLKQIG